MPDPADPRTATDDDQTAGIDAPDHAANRGQSANDPAEGADDESPEQPGSPKG